MKRAGRKRILSFILVIIMLTSLCGFYVQAEDSPGNSPNVNESDPAPANPSPSEPAAPSPSEPAAPSPSEPAVPIKQGLIPQGGDIYISDFDMFEGQTKTLELYGKFAILLTGTWTSDCDVVEITAGASVASSIEIKAMKPGKALIKCEYMENHYISFTINVKKCTLGSFSVQKYIIDTQTPLSGATFTLSSKFNPCFSCSQTTPDNGLINFTNLLPGIYTLTETTPPPNYAGAGPWKVTVDFFGIVSVSGNCGFIDPLFHCGTLTVYNAPLPTYTVTYNGNVSGTANIPSSQSKAAGVNLTLSSTIPTYSGHTFTGWNTKADGTGDSYAPSATYTADADLILYAQWSSETPTIYYTVTYNGNASGATNIPSSQTKTAGMDLTLSSTIPTYSGHTFMCWNTKADGTGDSYAPNGNYTSDADLILYAKWSSETPTTYYTITYNGNASGAANIPSSQTKTPGVDLTLSSTTPTYSGYSFTSWNTNANGTGTSYSPGATYTANADLTLYAQWSYNINPPIYPDYYTVTYDGNASGVTNVPSSQTKISGTDLTLSSTIPTYSGHTFTGWNTTADGSGVSYASGAIYTANASLYLYAQWSGETPPTVIPESPPPLGPTPVPVTPIPENPVPGAATPVITPTVTPQTSDSSNILLLGILAILSAAGLGTVGIVTRKKKHNK